MAIDVAALYASLGLDHRDFAKGAKKVKGETKKMDKGFGTVTKTLKGVAAAMGIAFGGAMVTRALVNITKLGVNFDQTMRQVKVIARATGEEFTSLTAIAEKMGSTTEYTSQQSAEALKFLSMAGLEAVQSIKALPQVLNLATAAQMDLATAADISTNIMTQMGLEVTELTKVNDALAAVQSTANTNVLQAAEAFVYAGTRAKQFGVDTESLAAMIGMLANSGIKATMAGTTLRQAMIKLLSPTAEAKGILEKYNIIVEDGMGGVRSFTDVLYDLADANISVIETTELFGARAGNISAILDKGSGVLREYIGEIKSMEGFSDEAAEELRSGLWGMFKNLEASIEHLGLVVFKTYREELEVVLEVTIQLVDAMADLVEWSGKFVNIAMKIAQYTPMLMPLINIAKGITGIHKELADETIETSNTVAEQVGAIFETTLAKIETVNDDITDQAKKRVKKDKDLLEDWLDVKKEIGTTDYQLTLLNLDRQYQAYKRVAEDTVSLEEWKSDQIRMIEAERTSELMGLYRELYTATGIEDYAIKAIEAYQSVMEEQARSWRAMGMEEDEILAIMESRMDKYTDEVIADFGRIVDGEQNAADKRLSISEQLARDQTKTAKKSATTIGGMGGGSGIGSITGMPVGSGTSFQVRSPRWGMSQEAAMWAAGAASQQNKELLLQMGYYSEAEVNYLESIGVSLESMVDWSRGQARRDIERSKMEKETAAMQRQEKYIQQQTEAFENFLQIGGSIDDLLDSMMIGPMAPSLSAEYFKERYDELLALATSPPEGGAAEAVQDFMNYVPQFLQFMGAYGVDYATLFADISVDLTTLEGMYDLAGLLAGLGFGDTISELEQVIDLMGMGEGGLGYSLNQIATSAIAAAMETGLLSEEMGIDLLNSMGALSAEITASDGTVVTLEQFLAGTEKLSDSFVTVGGETIVFKDYLADPTSGLEKAIDDAGGQSNIFGGHLTTVKDRAEAAKNAVDAFMGSEGVGGGLWALSNFMGALAGELGLTWDEEGLKQIIEETQLPPPAQWITAPLPWVEGHDNQGYYWFVRHTDPPFFYKTPYNTDWVQHIAAKPEDTYPFTYQVAGEGALTSGLTIAGELGPEWIVPTYEPQRSSFLDTVGASPEKIGEEVMSRLLPVLEKGQHITIQIDGKELMNVIIDAGNSDEEYIESIRGIM